MEEITDWNDEFKIKIKSSQYEIQREQEDEVYQEAIMLMNVECEDLKRFLVQEAGEKHKFLQKLLEANMQRLWKSPK